MNGTPFPNFASSFKQITFPSRLTKEEVGNNAMGQSPHIVAAVLLSLALVAAERGLGAAAADHRRSDSNQHTASRQANRSNRGIQPPVPSTCNSGCIPLHLKLKEAQPNCCREGHTTFKCPRPAHYQCGSAPASTRKRWTYKTSAFLHVRMANAMKPCFLCSSGWQT